MSFPKEVLLFRDAAPDDGGGPPPAPPGFTNDVPGIPKPGDTPPAPAKDFGYRTDDTPPPPPPPAPAKTDDTPPAPPAPPVPPKADDTPPPPPPAPEVITADDIREAVKQAGKYGLTKYDILREAGFDDFAVKMLEYRDKTGDVTPYLEAKTVDYTKMSEEQLLRRKLEKENPGMSQKALDFKLRKELEDKYYLDREVFKEDSAEAEYGREQLRIDTEKLKTQFIEEQNSFKAPEPKPDTTVAEKQAAAKERATAITTEVMNNPATKSLQEKKTIPVGEGEESFNFPIEDVPGLVALAENTLKGSDVDMATVNLNDLYVSLAFAGNVKKSAADLIKHGITLGKRAVQAELENSGPNPPGPSAGQKELTPAQQLAKNGYVVNSR